MNDDDIVNLFYNSHFHLQKIQLIFDEENVFESLKHQILILDWDQISIRVKCRRLKVWGSNMNNPNWCRSVSSKTQRVESKLRLTISFLQGV